MPTYPNPGTWKDKFTHRHTNTIDTDIYREIYDNRERHRWTVGQFE